MSELACLFLFDCAVSLAWGQKAYYTTVQFWYGLPVTYLGWPLHLHRGLLPPRTSNEKLDGRSAVSTRLPTSRHLLEKQVTSLWELRPMHDSLLTHLQEPYLFWFTSNAFLKRTRLVKVQAPTSLFYKEATCKSSTIEGLLYAPDPEKCQKGTLSDQPRLSCVTSWRFCAVGDDSCLKIWHPLGLTLRCMPYGRGTLRIPLRRIL
jgi:hypothetical protein